MNVFLFVRDLESRQVISIFELSPEFLEDEHAIILEKKELSQRYPGPRYSITEARGPDLRALLQGFPDLGGARRTVPIDLWRHQLTRYRYIIGRTSEEDRVDIQYIIESLKVPISYLTDAIGATSTDRSFEDLRISAATDRSCDVRLVPLETRAARFMTVGLHLWPPVDPGSTRRVAMNYTWAGMWNPLRQTGEDSGLVTLSVQQTERLEIEFALPSGTRRAELVPDTNVGAVENGEADGGPLLRWITSPAAPGPYAYRIRGVMP